MNKIKKIYCLLSVGVMGTSITSGIAVKEINNLYHSIKQSSCVVPYPKDWGAAWPNVTIHFSNRTNYPMYSFYTKKLIMAKIVEDLVNVLVMIENI